MQPYFFPYLGYFELIANTDQWVVFDVVQYNRRSWMNRNRIQHPQQGWQYINVPVQHAPHGTLISAIQLQDKAAACDRILAQLVHYQKHAPYYRRVARLVQDTFAHTDDNSLCALNIASLTTVCDYLEIPFNWQRCSALGLALDGVEHAGQWALQIAKQRDASEYLNPPGGRELFVPAEWDAAGIRLRFTDLPALSYACAPYVYEPYLSILDVLMWCAPETVRAALHRQYS